MAEMPLPLVKIRNLEVGFLPNSGHGSLAWAVRRLDLDIYTGETLAIVGESGSGKSVTARAIVGLHDSQATRMSGSIQYAGMELVNAPESRLRTIRGKTISMIFQDPMSSLNPLMRIGDQIVEALCVGRGLDAKHARAEVPELLKSVGISHAEERVRQYPHEFSGGMLQRVMILMAVCAHPRLLIADEPTTALDVTVQIRILELIDRLKSELGMTVMLITHDLALVERHATRVAIMYAGRIVEIGPTADVLERPLHPYAEGLLDSIPRPSSRRVGLRTISGVPPTIHQETKGCAFAARCRYRIDRCDSEIPQLSPGTIAPEYRQVACIQADQLILRGVPL